MPTSLNEREQPRYRWVITASAATMLAISMGQIVNGLTAFFGPLEAEFGRPRGDISLINTAGLVGLAVGGIAMGFIADRIAIRRVALLGAAVTGLSAIAAAQAQSLFALYAIYFLAGALGGGALFAPLFALVGGWFRIGAGLAIGLVSAGQAIGQGGVPLANSVMIAWFGWRDALMLNGLASLAILVPLALLLREAPTPDVHGGGHGIAEPIDADRTNSAVLALCLAALSCCSLMSVPLMHLLPLIEGCGIAAPEAAGAVLAMMLSAIGGRVAFGALADRFGAIPSYLVASGWQTVLVLGFPVFGSLGEFLIFAPIYGFGYGGVMTCLMATIRMVAPRGRQASVTGTVLAFAWVGHGIGGYMGGFMFDLTLGYDLAFRVASIAGFFNLVILAFLWRITASYSGFPGVRRRGPWHWGRDMLIKLVL